MEGYNRSVKTSLFDLFKIGVGPSSSHTMGPMRAAKGFISDIQRAGLLENVARVQAELYGSLALTGMGHGTDRAILLGLLGEEPRTIDPAKVDAKLSEVRQSGRLPLLRQQLVPFRETENMLFHRDEMYPPAALTKHPNGMRFTAVDATGSILRQDIYFSIGGGFIVTDGQAGGDAPVMTMAAVPFPFRSSEELLGICEQHGMTIAELMLRNESALQNGSENAVREGILEIWRVMQDCVARGMETSVILPGGLNVRRRAQRLTQRLREKEANGASSTDPLAPLDWVSVYAMAVNEENAAGGRVVTAPTNGAAGIIPAVAHYYRNFVADADEEGIIRYFLASAAIGILYKENASISGAEVGCQGEVGVACSMAAGGLVAALGGTNSQTEHAAEIAMEHNLGMTCDPIGGLVQIPCIERNAIGAVKAVHACRMAFNETEGHKLSLDQVIKTMYQTGLDMQSRYKETSLAGLALNVIEC
jgi:L-serine dehydratase